MNTVKDQVKALLGRLPEDCSLEDIQYHLFVAGKIRNGTERAEKEGVLDLAEVERIFSTRTQE